MLVFFRNADQNKVEDSFMAAPHAFLDVLANSQIRDAYLAGRISIILTPDLETILWTNGAGAHFMGMRTVAETIGVESGFDRLTRHQIEAGLKIAKPVQVSGIPHSEAFLVNETHLPPLGKVVFLRSIKGQVDPTGSTHLIEGLSDETTAAALFDHNSQILQASDNFDIDWFEDQELQLVLDQAHSERRVKKRLLQKNPAMPIGVLELNHDPAIFLLIVAMIEDNAGEKPASHVAFAFNPEQLPLRFGWRINAQGLFEEVSHELRQAVGNKFSNIIGKSFAELAQSWNMDGDGTLRVLFKSHNAWGGHKIAWPVENNQARVNVTFHALPVYSRTREFVGFRGFALIETMETDQQVAATTLDKSPAHKGLSAQEHEAFSIIARTLQADLQQKQQQESAESAHETQSLPDQPAIELSLAAELAAFSPTGLKLELVPNPWGGAWSRLVPPVHTQSGLDLNLLQHMPLSILVYRDEKVLLANDHLLQQTGFPTLDSSRILRDWLPKNILQNARGELIPVRAQMRSIDWIDGKTASMICFLEETQKALDYLNQELHNVQKKAIELSTLLNLVSDGALIIDHQGIVHSLNDTAARILNQTPEMIRGQTFKSFFAPGDHPLLDQAFHHICQASQTMLHEGGERNTDLEVHGSDNEQILQVTFAPMELDAGYYLLLRDISQNYALSRQIAHLSQKNDTEQQQKAQNLARMGHQIRTPLTAVIGLSQLMLAEKYGPLNNDRYRAYLSDIVSAGEHIMNLVQNIDGSGKMPQNKIQCDLKKLAIVEIFNEVLAQITKQARERQIIMRTSLAADLAPILADARACRQMMLGILANALHLTPAGGHIIISIQNMAPQGVLFRVRDTGSGLSAAEMAALSQIDSDLDLASIWKNWGKKDHGEEAATHQFSALTVLGATKRLAEASKARFTLRSEPGKGTLAEIIFPFALEEEANKNA